MSLSEAVASSERRHHFRCCRRPHEPPAAAPRAWWAYTNPSLHPNPHPSPNPKPKLDPYTMTVAEVRDNLKKRGVDSKGIRALVVQRLIKEVSKDCPMTPIKEDEEVISEKMESSRHPQKREVKMGQHTHAECSKNFAGFLKVMSTL